MKMVFKILTKKGPGHRETEVTIDWTGISREDLMVLAKNAIVQDLQARIRKMEGEFPTHVDVVATEVVHRESAALWEYQPSIARVACIPDNNKIDKKMYKMLQGLSPEELKTLFAI